MTQTALFNILDNLASPLAALRCPQDIELESGIFDEIKECTIANNLGVYVPAEISMYDYVQIQHAGFRFHIFKAPTTP